MERITWLAEKRRLAEKRYDTIFSIDYDQKRGAIDESHRRSLLRFLALLRPQGTILDAACGTGKYWSLISSQNYKLLGIDQSQEMLAKAVTKYPNFRTQKLGLQEISFSNVFDGIICIDAMENVFPDDWPLVLKNFKRALTTAGYLYFTVEIANDEEISEDYQKSKNMGLPIVRGEVAATGGYHYYPETIQVYEWLVQAGFSIEYEEIGDGYHHLIAKAVNQQAE